MESSSDHCSEDSCLASRHRTDSCWCPRGSLPATGGSWRGRRHVSSSARCCPRAVPHLSSSECGMQKTLVQTHGLCPSCSAIPGFAGGRNRPLHGRCRGAVTVNHHLIIGQYPPHLPLNILPNRLLLSLFTCPSMWGPRQSTGSDHSSHPFVFPAPFAKLLPTCLHLSRLFGVGATCASKCSASCPSPFLGRVGT